MSALVISSEATKPLSLPTTPTHRQYRAIVFTHAGTVTDAAGCGTLLSLTVGIYDDAGTAWADAQEASRTQGGIGHTVMAIWIGRLSAVTLPPSAPCWGKRPLRTRQTMTARMTTPPEVRHEWREANENA